jgi:predicted enzyme related to lactoylglutathione lyase
MAMVRFAIWKFLPIMLLNPPFFLKNGWKLRRDNTDHIAFDDGVGQVSGIWVKGRKPMTEVGIVISIMVDDAEATVELIKVSGGKIIQPIGMDAPEITARFTDPAGNIFGIYQHRG